MRNNLRIAPRRIVGEFLTRPQDTQVTARTTDAFVGVRKDTRASEDAQLIEGLVGSTVKVGASIRKENEAEDSLRGRNDAVLDKPMDAPNGLFHSTKAYTEAYHGVKDEAQGIRFRDEYLSILRDNDLINTPDPEAQQQDIYKKLYGNYFNEEYLSQHGRDGLLTDRGLARIEEAKLVANSEFSKRGIEYKKEGFLNDTYTLVSDTVDTMLTAGSVSSDVLSASIDSNYEDYVRNNGYLVSKAEYHNIMLDKLGQKAREKARLGDTTGAMNMVTMVKGLRDREGNLYDRITDTDPKDGKLKYGYRDTIDSLEAEVQKEVTAMERIQTKVKTENMEKRFASYVIGISDLSTMTEGTAGRFQQVASLRDRLQNDMLTGTVDPDKGKTLLNKLDDMYNQKGVAKSDSGAFRSAIQYVQNPSANFDNFVKLYGNSLDDKDFLTLTNKLHSTTSKVQDEKDRTKHEMYKEFYNDVKKNGTNSLKVNTIFSKLDNTEADRVGAYEQTFVNSVALFEESNGRKPSRVELVHISEEAKKIALIEYPMMGVKGGNNGNTSGKSPTSSSTTTTTKSGEGQPTGIPAFDKLK